MPPNATMSSLIQHGTETALYDPGPKSRRRFETEMEIFSFGISIDLLLIMNKFPDIHNPVTTQIKVVKT